MPKINDLGLDILHAQTPPGVRRTQEEIAAYAGVTTGGIFMAEKAALKKLKRQLFLRNDPVLRELCDTIFK